MHFKQDEYGYNISTSTLWQRHYRVLELKLSKEMDRMRWTSCMATQVTRCNSVDFFKGLYEV